MTIISLSSPITEASTTINNFDEVKPSLADLYTCTDFRFYSNSEILIYSNRQIVYSCSFIEYKDNVYITHVYNKTGLVWHKDFDYGE